LRFEEAEDGGYESDPEDEAEEQGTGSFDVSHETVALRGAVLADRDEDDA
jgi:hypothetical protein